MADGLDFSLPDDKKKRGVNPGSTIILIVLVLLTAANLWFILGLKDTNFMQPQNGADAEDFKQLAGKLEARNLHEQAAQAWQDYFQTAELDKAEQARILYRIGDEYLKADMPEKAVSYFYRSEMAAKTSELAQQINMRLKEAFEQAGEFAALRYEMMARTTDEPLETGAEVVAEIGPRQITMAELDEMIGRQIDIQLQQMSAFLPPEQYMNQKEAMTKRFVQPQARLQFLQSQMMEEALQREALARELDEDKAVKQQIRQVRRQVLAQALLNKDVAGKINLTESDLENYYEARKDEFMTPPQVRIRHVTTENEAEALNAVDKLKSDEEPGTEQTVRQDRGVPGLSQENNPVEKLFSVETGTVLDPINDNGTWHVIRVEERISPRQQGLDEVRNQIYQRLFRQKQEELQQQLAEEMMDKYDIVIHQDKFVEEDVER